MSNLPKVIVTSSRLTVGTAMLLSALGTAVEHEPESGNVYLIKDIVGVNYEQAQAKTA